MTRIGNDNREWGIIMVDRAKVVIVGAGIVGCSAAYHLAKLGWKDILVLDKGELYENDGSTSHAPGGVVPLSHSKLMSQFGYYTTNLLGSLKPFSPDRNHYNPVGQIELAISQERMADLVRLHGDSKSFGIESHLLTPQETKEKMPLLNENAFLGALFIPSGAIVSGAQVCGALARDAMETGAASFMGETSITNLDVQNGRIVAVHTNNPEMPRIECEQLLLCANIWSPAISEQINVPIPLMAFEHQYVVTQPLPELSQFDSTNRDHEVTFPTTRELDSTMYYRQHWGAYGVGSYYHKPHPVHPRDVNKTAMHPFTADDFAPAWEKAQNLFPMFCGAELERAFNGMFAFSVDGYPIIGETDVKGVWSANASWITHAGGVGKSVAEWMVHGETEWDMRQAHIHRFAGFQTTQHYIDVVTAKNYREVYDIIHPRQPITEPRNIRFSPFHPRLEALDASFTAFAGIELPNWFESNARLLEKYDERIPQRTGWASQYWSRIQGAEHLATRENVALFDLTGLSIIEVRGPGALSFVDYLCSSRMDKPVGSVIYTTWLTPKGGIKRDLTVARISSDCFWMFVGEGTLPQDMAWVREHLPQNGTVVLQDVSNNYTALGLWGPNARRVLQKVTMADVSNQTFPYFTSQWIEIGAARVLALRISYAGELGWELHIPMDQALPVWDLLWEAGRALDMVPAGMGAFDSLRLEKGYRLWGGDIYTEYDPYEANMGWTVRLKKDNFIGKDACLVAKERTPKKKLCCLTLSAPDAVAMGYEPIFDNGTCIGHVTSANYGYSVGKFIIYGYLPTSYAAEGNALEIEYEGKRYAATVSQDPQFDPKMDRLR
ncbi:MAG: FAD-dependent oxidoreductase [Chloroflexota bacterium]